MEERSTPQKINGSSAAGSGAQRGNASDFRKMPTSERGSRADNGSGLRGLTASDNSIPTNTQSVNKQYSVSERTPEQKREILAQARRDTAGEIEARDAASRRTLTPEERKNKAPDLGDENTVFAEDGKSYSIGEIVGDDQTNYGVGVHLDSTLLENLTPKERTEMVKERVKELGGEAFTAYDSAGNAVNISIAKPNERFKNRNGKKKLVNKDLTEKYIGNETKQESVVLLDELIETASFDTSKKPAYSHGWLDNGGENSWDYWTTYVQDKNGTIWEATLNIANATDGRKILYDIGPIKKVGQSIELDTSPLPTGQSIELDTSTVNSSIRSSEENVNRQYSVSERTPEQKKEILAQARRYAAGEIEARDVSKRRELTAEQRRGKMPDLGDENTVFAEDGVSYSINNTRDMLWEEQVQGYFSNDGTIKSSDSLYLGESSVNGVEDAPMYIPTSVIAKAIRPQIRIPQVTTSSLRLKRIMTFMAKTPTRSHLSTDVKTSLQCSKSSATMRRFS